MKDAPELDCVIAFSFGYRRHGDLVAPGSSNDDLARFAADHYRAVPKILQFEVADAYARIVGNEKVIRIDRNHHRPDAYLDTRGVAVQAAHHMRAHGWKVAGIVAHPAHLDRARRVCQRLGIATSDSQLREMASAAIRFDPESAQRWTRSPGAYRRHEAFAHVAYAALRYT